MTFSSPLRSASPPSLERIQAPVQAQLDKVVLELRRVVLSDLDMVEEVNDYLLTVKGKLLRPTLLLLSNEIGGRPHQDAITLAAVVELVHLATLVHDDAVDHSVLRRGMPTVNSLWNHQVAIIMGDYLYSRAVTELTRLGRLEAIRVLASAANEMSVGEMRQLTAYDALTFTEEECYRLIASKTASLMAAACEMGALLSVEHHRDQLRRFGHNLGMAFQITDDILDYEGSEAETGKPTGLDLRERKVTLPLIGALKSASEAEKRAVRHFFTLVDPSDEDVHEVVRIVCEAGGVEYARSRADHYGSLALESLEGLAEGPAKEALQLSVFHAIERRR